MPFLRAYGTLTVTGTTAIRIPMIKRSVVDFAVGADWTPTGGDVKIAVDGAAPTNVTNLPTAVASGNGTFWEFVLTAAELTCKQSVITIVDSATKAVEDNSFVVETFGNASAMYPFGYLATNPANLTQIDGVTTTGRITLGGANATLEVIGTNAKAALQLTNLTASGTGLKISCGSGAASGAALALSVSSGVASLTFGDSAAAVTITGLVVPFNEPQAMPSMTSANIGDIIAIMGSLAINKFKEVKGAISTTGTVFMADGTTNLGTGAVSTDDGTTFTRGKYT